MHGLWILFHCRCKVYSIKFMLGRGMGVKKDNGSSDVKWDSKFRVFNGKRDLTSEGVIMYGDAIVSELVLVEERMGEFGTKPQSLVDHKNVSLSTGLTNVGCCASDNWHILFTDTIFGIVGGETSQPLPV